MTSRQLQDLTPQELVDHSLVVWRESSRNWNKVAAEAMAWAEAIRRRELPLVRAVERAHMDRGTAASDAKTMAKQAHDAAVGAAEAAAETEAAKAVLGAALETAVARAAGASTRLPAAERAAAMEAAVETAETGPEARAVARAAEKSVISRTAALAYLDIARKERMMGQWPVQIQEHTVSAAKQKALDLLKKQQEEQYEKSKVKKHMDSMLGDWDKAGKLSKRRIRKNIRKTKRRRQKITKRRRK